MHAGCDELDEDCYNGKINTCNEGCADLILPLWTSCQKELGSAAQVLEGVIDLCRAAPGGDSGGGSGAHEVQQFAIVCPEGALIKNCVPSCTKEINGDELLLNIFGEHQRSPFHPTLTPCTQPFLILAFETI
jgi:hypothetical protein